MKFNPDPKHGHPPPLFRNIFRMLYHSPLLSHLEDNQLPSKLRNNILRMTSITVIVCRKHSHPCLLYAVLHLFRLTPALEEIAVRPDWDVVEEVEVVDGVVDVMNRLVIT